MVIGWLYLFGGLSGGRRIVAASVLDRVLFVPLVLEPLAVAGVFPYFLLTFALLDPALGCFSVDWTARDLTLLPVSHRCSSQNCR